MPLDMFLAGQNERQRLEMRVDQKQKSLVADRFAFETQHVDRVAAQEHSDGSARTASPIPRRSFRCRPG